jgi:hypothetical protein
MRRAHGVRIPQLVFSLLLATLCLVPIHGIPRVGTSAASPDPSGALLNAGILVSAPGNHLASGEATYAFDHTMHLPMVMRSYRPFVNGDFEQELIGWDVRRGPFSGHGSGLPQSVVVFDQGKRALLGKAGSLPPNSIPVGYGTIAQTFTLGKPYVRLQYWVFSYDKAKGEERYYDTLEVSVNRAPDQISDAERDSKGCASTLLNPQGTLTVSGDGLVFCGGINRPGQGTLWDTQGWKTVTLDLSAFHGSNITLYFTMWSREYKSPNYNDQGWFNTWAYVDNVQLTNSTQ